MRQTHDYYFQFCLWFTLVSVWVSVFQMPTQCYSNDHFASRWTLKWMIVDDITRGFIVFGYLWAMAQHETLTFVCTAHSAYKFNCIYFEGVLSWRSVWAQQMQFFSPIFIAALHCRYTWRSKLYSVIFMHTLFRSRSCFEKHIVECLQYIELKKAMPWHLIKSESKRRKNCGFFCCVNITFRTP